MFRPAIIRIVIVVAIVAVALFLSARVGETNEPPVSANADDLIETSIEVDTVKAVIETNQGAIHIELWHHLTPKTVENFVKLAEEGFYEGIYFHRVIPDFMIQGGDPNTKDGDRSNDGSGGPGYQFEDECYTNGAAITGAISTEPLAARIWTEVIVPYMQKTATPDPEIAAVVSAVQAQNGPAPIMEKTVEFFVSKTGSAGLFDRSLIHPVDYGTLCMANSGVNTNGSQFFIVTKEGGAPWLNGKHTVFGKVTQGMDVVHTIEALPRDSRDNPLVANQAIITKVRIVKD